MKKIVRITESQLEVLIKRTILNEVRLSKKPIEEDVIHLRTMTRKSVIHFGQYNGQTIEEILRLGKNSYLRFIYYNIEGVSFIEDILRNIGIVTDHQDDRIPKPGKNPELGEEVEKRIHKRLDPLSRVISKNRSKGRAKSKAVGAKIRDERSFSRGSLARKNQGH